MKTFSRILALILTVAMLAAVMAACGDKKDESNSGSADNGSAQTADNGDNGGSSAAGSEQTWGDITVFVPDTLELKGGDLADESNTKALRLLPKEGGMTYINLTLYDNVENAELNIDTTKEINEEYAPKDLTYSANGIDWKGVEYDSYGMHCIAMYGAAADDKVYFSMSAGFELSEGGELASVINSLK